MRFQSKSIIHKQLLNKKFVFNAVIMAASHNTPAAKSINNQAFFDEKKSSRFSENFSEHHQKYSFTSYHSGPSNHWLRVSTSDARKSHIISFVSFLKPVRWRFGNARRICKKKFCFRKSQNSDGKIFLTAIALHFI